jgi:hypothetical protein
LLFFKKKSPAMKNAPKKQIDTTVQFNVLSSKMDLAESGFSQHFFFRGGEAHVFLKIQTPTLHPVRDRAI